MSATILTMYESNPNESYLDLALQTLRDGGIIIYPTDTLYALGCDSLNPAAIEKICRIKGINPQKTHLSIICTDISMAAEYARIDNRSFKILKEYTPGPYTFLLPASSTLPKQFKGRKTVGVRIPDNRIARTLAEQLGRPILTTSVEIDPDDEFAHTMPDSIAMRYNDTADIVIDAGEGGATPSTIVDLTDSSNPEVIRQGTSRFTI